MTFQVIPVEEDLKKIEKGVVSHFIYGKGNLDISCIQLNEDLREILDFWNCNKLYIVTLSLTGNLMAVWVNTVDSA